MAVYFFISGAHITVAGCKATTAPRKALNTSTTMILSKRPGYLGLISLGPHLEPRRRKSEQATLNILLITFDVFIIPGCTSPTTTKGLCALFVLFRWDYHNHTRVNELINLFDHIRMDFSGNLFLFSSLFFHTSSLLKKNDPEASVANLGVLSATIG